MDGKEKPTDVPVSVFLSYAQADREIAEVLEQSLRVRSISVWRDKTSLHAGVKWPKALGEAIQNQKALVLLWSAAASRSEFVELEWNIALALKKPVLPILLDETSLPASLHPTQGINERESRRIVEQIVAALTILESSSSDSAPWQSTFIRQLDNMPQRDPHQILEKVKIVLRKDGWAVSGPVYQASGDIHIHRGESNTEAIADRWKVWVGIGVGILTAAILVKQLLFDVPPQAVVRTESAATLAQPNPTMHEISGIVTDESDPPAPIQGANIVVMGSSASTVTAQEGDFTLPVHGSKDLVLINITKDGFYPVSEYYPVPRKIHVVLRKK